MLLTFKTCILVTVSQEPVKATLDSLLRSLTRFYLKSMNCDQGSLTMEQAHSQQLLTKETG